MKKKQPKTENVGAPSKKPRERKARRAWGFHGRQSATSIYFLLWAIFTALSLFIVLFSVFTQQYMLSQAYREQATRELAEKGRNIERDILEGAPEWAGGNYSGYIRTLSQSYDVRIYILSADGRVLFPREPNFDHDAPEVDQLLDFTEETALLIERLGENGHTTYEANSEYVYGAKLEFFPNVDTYLYVGKSLELVETTSAYVNIRISLIAVFVFVLAFAVTSAVAGWFTNPITEMTKKARKLAQGDFDVDFHGVNYGREMVELAEALNFARDELSKTDRMQKELIANVSHDFKTPLTMIKGYASMIIEISGNNPEKRNKHAQVIVDEADRLASLVGDVLDLSKISSGIEAFKTDVVDVSAYLEEILDRFAYLRETKGYIFVTEIDEGLYTRADETKIGQALYNLIGNAVNYTGEDNTVYVRLKKESEDTFRFSVTDTGKGIKAEELGEIWNRYYRSTENHKRPVQGTGLGLSIVKTILERHRFRFGVQSEEGKGSTFYIVFPLVDETIENA
jgi:signal transduction histidine kinase